MRLSLTLRTCVRAGSAVAFATSMEAVEAQQKLTSWKATEVWRVDGTEGGEPFGDVRDYAVLEDGTLWVLDFKDQVIRRYGANGKPLSTVSRKGSGPGEMSNANGLAVAPDGSVWVNDPRNSRFSIFRPDGKFLRQITSGATGYGYRWSAWFNVAAQELVEQSISSAGYTWKRRDTLGTVLGTLPFVSCPSKGPASPGGYRAETKGRGSTMGSYPFTNGGGSVADGKGNMWCASSHATRVALISIGASDTIAQTTVELPSIPVNSDEHRAAIERLEKSIAQYATSDFDKAKVPSSKPGIAALWVDDDGRLWVQHARPFHVSMATFDVYDASAKHLARVTLPVTQREFLPIRARGDALWLTVEDADGVPSIVRFRLQR